MRTIALPIALAFTAAAVNAQCFDTVYGTPLGSSTTLFGDIVLPIQPLGFAFPIGTATYTDVHICDKGYVWLSNAGVPTPGGADFTASGAELASSSPRVCALWADIQTTSANGGQIYLKSTPTAATITWENARCFGATSGLFNMQLVLESSGVVTARFGPGTTNNSTLAAWQVGVAGLSPGLGAPLPAQTDLSSGGVVLNTTVYEEWPVANTFDMAGGTLQFTPIGTTGYLVGAQPGCAGVTSFGTGCVASPDSIYEGWGSGFDFNGGTVTWLRNGGGYTVLTAIPGTFVTPSASATNIASGQLDAAQVVTLSAPMPVPGGTTTSLCATTKGQIQVASTLPTAIDYTPTVAELLADTRTTFALWHDYNQTSTGSGLILFEEVAGVAYFTWNGVHSYSAATASTFQFQFEVATGNVTLVIATMGGFANPDPGVLGYSVGGASGDPGATDMSALAAALNVADVQQLALRLATNGLPTLGNASFALNTTNVPNLVPVGIQFFGTGVVNPGIDLTFLGMAGCFGYSTADLVSLTFPVALPAGTGSVSLPIPNSIGLTGLQLSSQSVCFTTATASGLATSNGILLTIGG